VVLQRLRIIPVAQMRFRHSTAKHLFHLPEFVEAVGNQVGTSLRFRNRSSPTFTYTGEVCPPLQRAAIQVESRTGNRELHLQAAQQPLE